MGCKDFNANPKPMYRPDSGEGLKIIYDSCIPNYRDNEWLDIINFYSRFNSGQLYYEGSYADQPAKFVESINLIDNLIREKQDKNDRILKGLKRGK